MARQFRAPRLGPAAITALTQATEARSCAWAIPNSDGFVFFSIFRIPDQPRESFLAALRDSDYSETQHHGAPVFSYDDGDRGFAAGPLKFAFIGPFVMHSQERHATSPAAVIDGLRAANPGAPGFE